MEAPSEAKEVSKDKPGSPPKSGSGAKPGSPPKPVEEVPAEIPEPETEEELEAKERFQELTVALKKYNKRIPEHILAKDFPKLIRLRGQNPTEKEIEDYIKNTKDTEKDPDGAIPNKKFFEILEERKKAPDTPEEFKKALLTISDENGKLLKEEMRFHLRTMGEPMEEKEVKKLLDIIEDKRNPKYVNIDSFVDLLFDTIFGNC